MPTTDEDRSALRPAGGGGERCGNYVLAERLGNSALVEVWRASSRGPDGFEREVALKRLRPLAAQDAQLVQAFTAAVKRASKLSHGRLVQVVDLGIEEGRPFCVMELVRGYDLARI